MMMAEALNRVERERVFANRQHSTEEFRSSVGKYYKVGVAANRYFEKCLFDTCAGRTVLELGCAFGQYSRLAAKAGARSVTGVDISDFAIKCAQNRPLPNVKYIRMNAEQLEFPDSSFDVVCGSAILHHLDVSKALSEISRVLRPAGVGLFIEPLGHNPIINCYRRLTPSLRSRDEHPLRVSDVHMMRQHFPHVEMEMFNLATLTCIFVTPLVPLAERVDHLIFKLPFMRRFAWMAVIKMLKVRPPQEARRLGERTKRAELTSSSE